MPLGSLFKGRHEQQCRPGKETSSSDQKDMFRSDKTVMLLGIKNEDHLWVRKGEKFWNQMQERGCSGSSQKDAQVLPHQPPCCPRRKPRIQEARARAQQADTRWQRLCFRSVRLVCRPCPRHTQLVSDKFSSGLREGNAVQRERWPCPGRVPAVPEAQEPEWRK